MTQKEATRMAEKLLRDNGIIKWHALLINFGANSNHAFDMKKRDNNLKFDKEDITYIDIGIVFDKTLEGDFG